MHIIACAATFSEQPVFKETKETGRDVLVRINHLVNFVTVDFLITQQAVPVPKDLTLWKLPFKILRS